MIELEQAVPELKAKPLYLCDNPNITTAGIASILRRWKAQHPIVDGELIVVVDFLQYIDLGVRKYENEASALKRAAYDLARIAKEFRCAVVAVAQLRNEAEGQPPHLRFLEGSGGIAQAAEAILLVDLISRREGEYDAQDWPRPFDVHVAAQRSGESGVKVNCMCDLRYGKFHETLGG
jgi:replicative DNA helicase